MKTVQNNDLSALQKRKRKYSRGVGSESIVGNEALPTCILESIVHIWSNSGGIPRICCCVVARSWAGLAVLSHSTGGRGAQGACGSHSGIMPVHFPRSVCRLGPFAKQVSDVSQLNG